MAYDAGAAFARIEEELIESMMRNLRRHNNEEDALGFNWSQWQVEQLKSLEAFRKRNAKKYGPRFAEINDLMDKAIRNARKRGANDQEIKILEMIRNNKSLARRLGGNMQAGQSFFGINERKMNVLQEATRNDMQRAEQACLRRVDDQYRKIIYDAQVYANSGAGTYAKAVDMATHDFLMRGIDCIVYKNGARHKISDYADMAIRTADKRAYFMGEGEMRAQWGLSLVMVNRRGSMDGNYGSACPHCIPWLGKVLVDDVYSGGRPDGKHQLLSEAMQQGLYHPRCKDSHTTYYPGISSAPDPADKEEIRQAVEEERQENRENYVNLQAEKYNRLANYSLDPENRRTYEARAGEWRALTTGYNSGPVMAALNAPGITNTDEVIDDFLASIELPDDPAVVAHVKNSVKHMPKKDLDFIREQGLVVRKSRGASSFVRSRRSRGKDGNLRYIIRINPHRDEPFSFAHECAHLAEKANKLYKDPEFKKVLENFGSTIERFEVGVVDGEYYCTAISKLLVEPYQGRTYVRHLGRFGPERPLMLEDLVEYISAGYECFIGDPKLLESTDPMLYNYFTRRGLR